MDEHPHNQSPISHDIVSPNTEVREQVRAVQQPQAKGNSFMIPLAIIVGFGLIAAAIYFSGNRTSNVQGLANNATSSQANQASAPKPVRPVDAKDHIRGNPNAPIVIVEYSDYDCPFCKQFHEVMQQVMNKYGSSGKVAWVYRHFPIQQLHPDAPRLALAGECVADLGGNDAFWKFTDLIFGERGVNEFVDMSRLDEFAKTAGVSTTAFEACLTDGRTKDAVQEDYNDAVNAGAKGTPYSVVLVGGQEGVINGAQPFSYVSQIMDTLISQMDGKTATSTK